MNNNSKVDQYQLADGTAVSTVDRFVKDTIPVERLLPSDHELFTKNADGQDQVNATFLRQHFIREGKLTLEQILRIIQMGTKLLQSEPNCLITDAPITICGDIHGQYYDLMKLFDVAGGEPPSNRFLFLGDYVDRGYFSLECYLYLLALKINHPQEILLLRGNHECRHLTKHFTFKLECNYKYGLKVYEACMESFDSLPLCAVVHNQYFCVHGGLSPDLNCPSDANQIDRFQDPPHDGLMCDLLWADPTEDFGSEANSGELFSGNRSRGCSYRYSYNAVCDFLRRNNLLSVIRGHEAQDAGYRLYRQVTSSEFPALITLFSAPNYVDVYNNKGAIMKYDGKVMNIRQFNCAPHPYYLPKFMNVFDWSLPFVGEKIAELLLSVLNIPSLGANLEGLSRAERERLEQEKKVKMDVIRGKIKTVGRINKMFTTVRDERETLTELMNVMGTRIIPSSYLTLGHEDLRRVIQSFEDAKKCDSINEMLPPEEEESDTTSVSSLAISAPNTRNVMTDKTTNENTREVVAPPIPPELEKQSSSPWYYSKGSGI